MSQHRNLSLATDAPTQMVTIVLEDLDMIANGTTGTCHPRDSKLIISVIE